jgi:hypothetical protein
MFRNTALAAALLVLGLANSASADIIVDQAPTFPNGQLSQVFPDGLNQSSYAFDDFTLSSKYVLTSLRLYGVEALHGDPTQNVSVTAQLSADANVNSPVLMSFTGSESGSDLVFDLGGALLGPGTYWISGFVTRPGTTGGEWTWRYHFPVSGFPAMWQNPGGGQGFGPNPIIIGGVTDEIDLAFRLEGHTSTSTVPAPPAVVLVGLGAGCCVALRRYVGRRATA